MRPRSVSKLAFLKDPSLSNAAFAGRAWKKEALWLDYLDPRSPFRTRRLLQRTIYENAFAPHFGGLRRGMRVADIGCGIGRFILPLIGRGCSVAGVDIDHGHLAAARRRARPSGGTCLPVQARAERLPFQRGSFDSVLAIETLSYVSDPLEALREIRRILRPNGILFLSVETHLGGVLGDRYLTLDQIGPALRARRCHVPGSFYSRYFSENELRRLLASGGFRILRFKPAHFVLDGILDPLVADPDLRKLSYRSLLLRLEATLASLPPLRPLARAWTVVALSR